jgi:hypothetical protein
MPGPMSQFYLVPQYGVHRTSPPTIVPVQLLRNIVILVSFGFMLLAWHRHPNAFKSSSPEEVRRERTVVITYRDYDDLLAQLRQVKPGQDVECTFCGFVGRVATGVRCDDKAGVAALKAQVDRVLSPSGRTFAEQKHLVDLEMARIFPQKQDPAWGFP